MTSEHQQKHDLISFADSLTALIESAPVGDSGGEVFQTTPRLCHVRESNGWGSEYIREIELRGEEWLRAYDLALPYAASGGILTFVGDRGPGKTQMAAEICRCGLWPMDQNEYSRADGLVTHRSKKGLYRRAMDIFLELREANKNHVKSSEREVLRKLSGAGLLVIDEFQERGESDFENRIMNNLLDTRYASGRPTIIIANLTRSELNAQLGPSVVNRATANGKSFNFNWTSYRTRTRP